MRAFIAIELPDGPREHLGGVQEAIESLSDAARGLRLEPAEKLHLTLKFLGEIVPPQTATLIESLHKVPLGPMALHAANLDCFPSRGPIRVVAANLAGDIRPLVGLVKQIEQRCQYLGFVQERRPYQPHVTLARARNGLAAGLRESLQQATRSAWPGPEFPIRQFVLMQSKLNATGSEYRVVESFGVA